MLQNLLQKNQEGQLFENLQKESQVNLQKAIQIILQNERSSEDEIHNRSSLEFQMNNFAQVNTDQTKFKNQLFDDSMYEEVSASNQSMVEKFDSQPNFIDNDYVADDDPALESEKSHVNKNLSKRMLITNELKQQNKIRKLNRQQVKMSKLNKIRIV